MGGMEDDWKRRRIEERIGRRNGVLGRGILRRVDGRGEENRGREGKGDWKGKRTERRIEDRLGKERERGRREEEERRV